MNVTRIVAAFVAAGLVAGSAMAQTKTAAPVAAPADDVLLKEGTILYGGTLSWGMNQWSGQGDKSKSESFFVAPEADYFAKDNLSLGLIASCDVERKKETGYNWTQTALVAELVGRYYMPICENKMIPYVGATLGGGYAMDSDSDDSTADSFLTTYGGQAGFLVPLNASVMFNTCLSYKRFHYNGYTMASSGEALEHVANKDRGETLLAMGFLVKY